MRNYYDLDLQDWQDYCKLKNWPAFRAGQLYRWQGRGLLRFDEMTDISKEMRNALAEDFFPGGLEIIEEYRSETDGTCKFLLRLHDGQTVEAVIMHYRYGASLCLSTQAGCRMGCRFCASTGPGFGRDLTAGELIQQLSVLNRLNDIRISRVVLMGIGEPLDNYENTVKFIRRAHDPEILNLSQRHITLSTCGLIPEIRRLADEKFAITLSISLHAPNQEIREQLMPISKKYGFDELLEASKYYFEQSSRRVSFEYALFRGINDKAEHAVELARRIKTLAGHVNLIPANEVPGTGLQPTSSTDVRKFAEILERAGVAVSVRRSLGGDIRAACGQLRRSLLATESS